MRNDDRHVSSARSELRRFSVLLFIFVFLLFTRFGDWQVHTATVGQLFRNGDSNADILAELDSIRMWLSLIPIALAGMVLIGLLAVFIAPIFRRFHEFGRIGPSQVYPLGPRRRLPEEPQNNTSDASSFTQSRDR